MRPWTGAALIVAMAAIAMPAAAQRTVYPSVRSEPPRAPNARVVPADEGSRRGLPSAHPERRVPDRARLRSSDGTADGFNDGSRLGRRGVARASDGTAAGSVDPARLGGGIVRENDGTARGIVPSEARRQTYRPR